MRTQLLPTAALLATLSVLASPARADLLTIGLQEAGVNSGNITVEATGSTGSASITALSYGTFTANSVSALGSPLLAEPNLDTNSINVSSSSLGTIKIYVTQQDITSPTGINQFLSSFTENLLNGSIASITEATYVDAGNNLFGLTSPLASHTFTSIGTATSIDTTPSLSNPFSETTVYTITATGVGDVNATIDISAVPEPASLALLGTGLLGLGLIRRRGRGV